jgi:hypothetical protein
MDDRADEMLVGLVVRQASDELDINLEVSRRKHTEIGQAGEAGAEVVQRKPASDLGEAYGLTVRAFTRS